jgi:hypothetical protein
VKNESSLQRKILLDLRSYGKYVEVFKIMKSSDNGIPDLLFTSVMTGPILLETKRDGETPRKLQQFHIDKINQCGCKAYYVDSWAEWVILKKVIGLSKSAIK